MRTKLVLIPVALAGIATAGCSLAFNGSHYQGGTGTDGGAGVDTGMPIDAAVSIDTGTPTDMGTPTDTGTPIDGGMADGGTCHDALGCPVPGTYCDLATTTCLSGCDDNSDCVGAGVCDTIGHTCGCARDMDCPMDSYCKSSQCDRCDNDADGYYVEGAPPLRCSRPGHLDGGDCNDNNPQVYPFARPDCSTSVAESCPLPFVFAPMLGGGATLHESGITATHTLWAEAGTGLHPMSRDPIFMFLGDDTPLLPGSGAGNGFVGFVANDATMRSVQGVAVDWVGPVGTAEPLFTSFHVGAASFGRTSNAMTGRESVTLTAAEVGGRTNIGQRFGAVSRPPIPFGAEVTSGMGTPILGGPGSYPSVASFESLGRPAGVVAVTNGAAPALTSFDPVTLATTGGANFIAGSWLVASGASSMWMADPTHVGIWNGNDSAISPPLVDLTAYTTAASPPQQIVSGYTGALAARRMAGGSEVHVAAVPIATTASPPTGRIALIRWVTPIPNPGDRTDAYIPSSVVVSELRLSPGAHLNGAAGVSLVIIDDATAMIAYQEGTDVMIREIPISPDPSRASPEDPPSFAFMRLMLGETVTSISLAGGFYPDSTMMAGTGRLGVAAMVERAGAHEIRVRAFEACVGP